MARRFARFRSGEAGPSHGYEALPNDGLCLSVFLIVRPKGRPAEVLLGRVNPDAEWGELGALSKDRLGRISGKWMLPSSHLLLFESPADAAMRIAHEQLEMKSVEPARAPMVFSEAYARPGSTGDPHWDLHFVYNIEWPGAPPTSSHWSALEFKEVAKTHRTDFARAHDEILDMIGLHPTA